MKNVLYIIKVVALACAAGEKIRGTLANIRCA